MDGSYRPRRRWLRGVLVWAGGTLAVAVIGLVIEAAVSPGTGQPQSPGSVFPVSGAASGPGPGQPQSPGSVFPVSSAAGNRSAPTAGTAGGGSPALSGPVQV